MSEPIDYEKQALSQMMVQHIQDGINLRANILALQAENARLTEQIAQSAKEKPAPETDESAEYTRVPGYQRVDGQDTPKGTKSAQKPAPVENLSDRPSRVGGSAR